MKKVMLIDGSNLLHRCFHAFMYLAAKDGTPTGAIYGTIKMIISLIAMFKPDIIIFFTDYSRKSFRTDMFPDYKGNRSETDPNLKQQFALMELICEKAGMLCVKKDGYEADDLIGTYANLYKQQGNEVLIVSGDKDLFQLVDENVHLVYSSTKDGFVEFDEQKCFEKFGLTPHQIIDLKAICGDSADNYKGILGIGEKTATKLLAEYNSLEDIYENIEALKGKTKEKFIEHKENAFLCQQLATINCSVPDISLPIYSYFNLGDNLLNFLKEKLDIKTL